MEREAVIGRVKQERFRKTQDESKSNKRNRRLENRAEKFSVFSLLE